MSIFSNLAVGLLILILVFLAVRALWKNHKQGGGCMGCSGGCDHCHGACPGHDTYPGHNDSLQK